MTNTKLIFVGGFLGAGKTTLLYEVSRRLVSRGTRVALITNDQAPDLVDTSLLGHLGINVAEVSGSCFCCDFKALRRAIDKVNSQKQDIIIAEPVGSCTDLAATLIIPIQNIMKTEVSVSPLTVLADPGRLKDIMEGGNSGIHPSAAYIIKKQLEESEIIVITKCDLYTREEINSLFERLKANFPECEIMAISARTGEGIDEWLERVLTLDSAGEHIKDIDYDKYAEGEAILGWLNCSASLSGRDVDWDAFTQSFMRNLALKFETMKSPVGHIKMIVESGHKYISASLTGQSETLSFRWSAGSGDNAEMIVNARVEMSPEELEKIFTEALRDITNGRIVAKINRLRSISPGYPKPTYRLKKK